jgi:tetraacyldisaccharide 4'-kinase
MGNAPRRSLNTRLMAQAVWRRHSLGARVARLPLMPLAGVNAVWMWARSQAYARGLLALRSTDVPVIAVGNLSVGGTGKTPISSWIASQCVGLGIRPGIVRRPYGSDETMLHRQLEPAAVVVTGRDRARAVYRAEALGARVIILDDGFQRLDVGRHLNVLVVSAESIQDSPWLLPAGPWREPWHAAGRADVIVVTRRLASDGDVRHVYARLAWAGLGNIPVAVAHLRLSRLTHLGTGEAIPLSSLRRSRVLAACAVGSPQEFAGQLAACGADVQLLAWPDHHVFTKRDLRALLAAGRRVNYVVVTHKDAVKLADHWPQRRPPALIAHMSLAWEQNGALLGHRISDLLTSHYRPVMYSAS